jgi:hypothetical protein
MNPEIPAELQAEIERWDELNQQGRSQLGKALRRLGLTYGEIRELIPVPKGTLSYWCRDIRLSDEQVIGIRHRTQSRKGLPRDTQWKRRLEVQRIQQSAHRGVPTLIAESQWVAGTVLYWAEGSKTTRSLAMVNSDPEVLRIFVAWIRRFHDADAEFTLALHLHHGNDEAAAKRQWLLELDLPLAGWTKTFVKPPGTGHRKNHLAWGVCRVRMRRSTDAFIRTMAWIDGLRGRLT